MSSPIRPTRPDAPAGPVRPPGARRRRPARHARGALGALAGALASLLALGGAAAQPPEIVVAVGATAEDPAYLPVHAAAALGTFEAEGVRVTLRRSKHPTAAMAAVRDREAQIAVTTLDQAIQGAWARGLPVRAVVAHVRAPAAALLVAPGLRDAVRRVEDLRGRVVGVPGPGTTGDLLLSSLLRRARVEPWQVDVRSLGGAPLARRLASGEVAAGLVEEPWVSRLLEAQRAVPLIDLRRPEEAARRLGGPFYEVVSVSVRAPEREATGRAARKKGPPPHEPPPEAALVAFARAVIRVQVWLATTPAEAVADRLPPALVGDRAGFVARLAAAQPRYVADGEATEEGLEASFRVLREGNPWPVTVKVDGEAMSAPPAIAAARRALGATPPAP
jgi:NitT/TauT family transport system substrate-binding protein